MLKNNISIKDPLVQILFITVCVIGASYLINQKLILRSINQKKHTLNLKLEKTALQNSTIKIYNELKTLEERLPKQKDPSWLLSQINEHAKQSELDIESILPQPTKEIPPYSYISFKMQTHCTFSQLLNFIKSIESSPYLLKIENVQLIPQKEYAEEETLISTNTEVIIGTIY